MLYVTGSNNFAWALDARTGRPFWTYRRDLPPDLTYGAQAPVNRGFAMLDHRLFMVTLDAHLLAFDRSTGRILWDIVLADYKIGYSATLAPLVLDGKVIVGISGGEYPTRGFLDAYDPHTSARATTSSPILCSRSIRQELVALFNRHANLGRGGHDVSPRRAAVCGDSFGDNAAGVCVALSGQHYFGDFAFSSARAPRRIFSIA